MNSRTQLTILLIALFTIGTLSNFVAADEPKQTSKPGLDYQKKVLDWIDSYARKQVLFCDEDLQRLRADLEQDSPEEAKQWWEKTADIRNALDSPDWEVTREWLREFLRVQAMYSDEQIAEIRKRAKQAKASGSTQELKDILASIERRRNSLQRGSANSRRLRGETLSAVNAFRRDQDAWQRAARARNVSPASAATNKAQPQRRPPRRANPPLVNSLDAARWNVMRNFWR